MEDRRKAHALERGYSRKMSTAETQGTKAWLDQRAGGKKSGVAGG